MVVKIWNFDKRDFDTEEFNNFESLYDIAFSNSDEYFLFPTKEDVSAAYNFINDNIDIDIPIFEENVIYTSYITDEKHYLPAVEYLFKIDQKASEILDIID